MARVSLSQQIDELQRELNVRADVYPRQVAARKLRQGVADYQRMRMEEALKTLIWLRSNERMIRARCPELFEARS